MESSWDSASEASSPYGTVSGSSSNGQMDVLDPNGYYTLLGLTASAQVKHRVGAGGRGREAGGAVAHISAATSCAV
jgi:hypothetical protein